MFVFPPTLAPPAPFPLVLSSAVRSAFVAPGVERASYSLTTSAGPLIVNLVAVDLAEPTVRLGAVVARDRLISPGETVSSMAARSGAIAGVNADYFDIGQTNQPLGIVVRDGTLLRTPSTRGALAVTREKAVRFTPFRFSGSVAYGTTQIALTGIDEWPPQGGASLLTSAYGDIKPATGVMLATLTPLRSDLEILNRSYRVDAVGEVRAPRPSTGILLGLGPAALGRAPPPSPGDVVTLSATLDPPLGDVTTAVGGGPILVRDGASYDDPNPPAPEERDRRFPVSGAATTRDASLLLLAVDGRSPLQSIGLTRTEFGALMLGFGAGDGMAFDSGGSATLVARILGDERVSVVNVPSDGVERVVADGLFVYSDAPYGVNPHLIVRPNEFTALPGVQIPLQGAIVDEAGHRLRGARVAPLSLAPAIGSHTVVTRELDGRLSASVRYRTVGRLGRLTIESDDQNPDPGAAIRLRARGYDETGGLVFIGDVAWSSSSGTIAADGTFRAGNSDATIVASAGGATASLLVHVGRRLQSIGWSTPAAGWQFSSYPSGGKGSISLIGTPGEPPMLQLAYDFNGSTRAAYANATLPLPGAPLRFSLDVFGDGGAALLRAAFVNRFGERRALTLAKAIDWIGWRRVEIALPRDLNAPVTLASLYVVAPASGPRGAGTIGFRNLAVTLPGSQ